MDDTVIAAGRCSESQVTQKVSEGPEFLDGPDSEHGPGGPRPGRNAPSATDSFRTGPISAGAWRYDVLAWLTVFRTLGVPAGTRSFAECARLCYQLRIRARGVATGR